MKDFVLYQEALALKELGFDEKCFGYFDPLLGYYVILNRDCINPKPNLFNHNSSSIVVSAPLYQQAFKWFREKYNEYFNIHRLTHRIDTKEEFMLTIDSCSVGGYYETYEEAELECLVMLINIIKKQNLKG